MCGLAGVVGLTGPVTDGADVARRMAGALVHRGPDGSGEVTSGPCAFAFRRLAIVDLDAPSPPFPNEDRSVWSMVNGEIYNSDELVSRLLDRGHRLATRVDTEVVPHLYEEHGAALVHVLNGMFAIAIWDAARQTLLLARDRAGEKPLYWWRSNDELAFASELRALLTHPRIARRLDPVALRRYLLHGYYPAPLTPIAGVGKLPAGHVLVAERGSVTVRRYWGVAEHHARRGGDDATAEALDRRIALSVERRRRADVPVGVFLSGGIDSCTILAHMAEQQGEGVPVFSLGHADREYDESWLAAESARHLGADFHRLVLGEADLDEGLRRVGESLDEPLGDASIVPTYLVSAFARERVKVVLSGEGADEMFAGYPTYAGHRIASAYRRLPRGMKRAFLAVLGAASRRSEGVGLAYLLERFREAADRSALERHHLWFGSVGPEMQERVLAPKVAERLRSDDAFASAREHWPRGEMDELSRFLATDFTMYLQDDLLAKVDRATMLVSLESRAPYLDHELVEWVAGLPAHLKLSGFTTKALLRRAAIARLPARVLSRRKRGFNVPFSRWLRHGLAAEMRSRFSEERVAARGLLSSAGIARLLDDHLAGRADHRKALFTILMLDVWCDCAFGDGASVPLAGE